MKKTFLALLVGSLFLVGCEESRQVTNAIIDTQMDPIYQKVVDDSIHEYEIVKKNGEKMETCVHAGMVKAAYLQAKDEANYKKWNDVEKSDCKVAGMPM
jgi:outer membrane lipoprotein-sorting protein